LTFVVGDTLMVVNQDEVDHQPGRYGYRRGFGKLNLTR
jgi:hypothetical protein